MNVHVNANVPMSQQSLPDVVAEYENKRKNIPATIDDMKASIKNVEIHSQMGAAYVGSPFSRGEGSVPSQKSIEHNLLKSAWKHVYNGLNIQLIASAKDRSRFDLALENPPEFTVGNIGATFGDYLANSRTHILKGLAEAFIDLDPAYKSHSKVKIGVKGLPKRVIIKNIVGDYGIEGYGAKMMKDMLNAVRVYRGLPHLTHGEFADLRAISEAVRSGAGSWRKGVKYQRRSHVIDGADVYVLQDSYNATGQLPPSDPESEWTKIDSPEPHVVIKTFANGNGHVHFSPEYLRDINKALAEFYGDILPDTPDENPQKKQSTEVAKDLQFYWTSDKVIDEILNDTDLRSVEKVLEPSCGDGRVMNRLYHHKSDLKITGVEVDPGRALEARDKGFNVMRANFLQVAPNPIFDMVLMNPPFYGTHWKKHVLHARKFLKPDGKLIAILPASAFYDGHLDDLGIEDKRYGFNAWRDLPIASFAEAGTNVPTGYIKIGAE